MFQIIFASPSFSRTFADLTYASTFSQEIPEEIDTNLSSLSEDELFSFSDFDDDSFSNMIEDSSSYLAEDSIDYFDILGDTTLRDELNKTDDGSWNFILGKIKTPHEANRLVKKLNDQFKAENLNVQAMNWEKAAASYTTSIEGIGIIFNLLIIILAVVVFIIIMNTMTVSVIERTSEIGTMRALGAEKTFVKKLFYTEAVSITLVSSILGTIVAFIFMGIFNSCNITITNTIAKMILGGGQVHFSPTFPIIISTIIIASLGSLISNIYPVSSALKITPLKALSKGGV